MSGYIKNKRRSNWITRNNSANVAAVLHSKLYADIDSDDNIGRCCLGDNNCYCKEKKIKPRLFPRPKSCECRLHKKIRKVAKIICDPCETCSCRYDIRKAPPPISVKTNSGDLYRSDDVTWKPTNQSRPATEKSAHDDNRRNRKSPPRTFRKDSSSSKDDFVDDQITMNTKFDKIKTSDSDFYYTESEAVNKSDASDDVVVKYLRHQSDNGEDDSTTHIQNGISTMSDSKTFKHQKFISDNKFDDRKSIASTPKSRKGTSETLKPIKEFRKEHYFETHSVEDLIKEVPPHTCIHRFALDDRLLPISVNSDSYGTSRCVICGKPMENPNVTTEDERTLSRDKSRTKSIFPQYYKYGLAPRKIFMGNSDVKIETIANDDVKKQPWYGKIAKPNYFNTYALRYQAGVY